MPAESALTGSSARSVKRFRVEALGLVSLAVVVGVTLSLSHCDPALSAVRANDRRVLLVGVEGISLTILDQILSQPGGARLPNLARFRERGAVARILQLMAEREFIDPASAWTSFMTGVPPVDTSGPAGQMQGHGIGEATVPIPHQYGRQPVTSQHRKVPALWNMLSDFHVRQALVGLWGTWPAEQIDGMVVSDRFFLEHFDAGPFGAGGRLDLGTIDRDSLGEAHYLTYPLNLDTQLAHDLEVLEDVESENLARLIEESAATTPAAEGLGELVLAVRTDALVKQAALQLLARDPEVQLVACQFESVEVAGRHSIRGYYAAALESLDRHLSQLLDAMGPETSVVLLSSHAFRTGADDRDYNLNGLLERLGLLVRGDDGAIDFSQTRVFDSPASPRSFIRKLAVNFEGEYPQGCVQAPDENQRTQIEEDVRDQLLAVMTDTPWKRPLNGEMVRDLLWQVDDFSTLEIAVWPQFKSNTNLHLDGGRVPIDSVLPTRSFAGRHLTPGFMMYVPPASEASAGNREPPIGEDWAIPGRVVPTLLAMLGLPRPTETLELPAKAILWLFDRPDAQRMAVQKVPSYGSVLRRNDPETEAGAYGAMLCEFLEGQGLK